MPLLRRVFFYVLVLVYVVFCPLTILYSLGYLLKPGQEKGGLVKTGLIYLSTAPPGASVYIGNKRYIRKTPTILRDLIPGEYPIKLYLKDHKLWFENIPVEAEKATALERILLLPEQLNRKELLPEAFGNLIPLEEADFFLLSRGKKIEDFFIYDWKEEKLLPIVSTDSPIRGSTVLSHFTVAGSPFFVLQVRSKEGEKYLRIEPKGREVEVEDLTHLFLETPSRIEWDPRDKNHLFTLQDHHLNRLDVLSKSVYPKFLENIQGFGCFNKSIYVLRENGLFERVDHEGRVREIFLKDLVLAKSLFGEKDFFEIKMVSKDIILFLGEKGQLLSSRLPYRFLDAGTLGFRFSPHSERLVLWEKRQLGLVDFSKIPKDEKVFENGPRLFWIFKRGEKIKQAFWVYEGAHILFRDADKVFLLELETYGKPHLNFLVQVKKKSSVFYSDSLGKLYYLEGSTDKLCSIEVLPKREILLLPFPERKEEKKESEIHEL